jgi:hypothetical protein
MEFADGSKDFPELPAGFENPIEHYDFWVEKKCRTLGINLDIALYWTAKE